MYIDKHLNIVIEIDREDGMKLFVHSTPISKEVFEVYFLPISKAFSKMYKEGLDGLAGPRVAALFIKEAAVESGMWEGAQGVENGLFGEIVRLTNVICPNPEGGWQTVMMANALKEKLFSDNEKSEVMGILSFFTLVYQMHQRKWVDKILRGLLLWETLTTSSNVTEYMNSLSISTTQGNTGEKALPPLSLPS